MTSQGPFWPTMMRWTLGKWNSIFGIALFVCFPSRQMWKGKWTVNNIWMLIITSSVYVRHPFSLGCSFKMANSGDLCPKMDSRTFVNHMTTSGDNLLKNRPRASTSKYKQLPINLRLFQNTVKFFLSEKAEIRKWKIFTQIVLFWIQSTLLSFFLISISTFGSQVQVILQKHLHS